MTALKPESELASATQTTSDVTEAPKGSFQQYNQNGTTSEESRSSAGYWIMIVLPMFITTAMSIHSDLLSHRKWGLTYFPWSHSLPSSASKHLGVDQLAVLGNRNHGRVVLHYPPGSLLYLPRALDFHRSSRYMLRDRMTLTSKLLPPLFTAARLSADDRRLNRSAISTLKMTHCSFYLPADCGVEFHHLQQETKPSRRHS